MRRAWLLIAITATGCGATRQTQGPPMSFAPNRGQFAPSVRFAAQGAGYELAAADGGVTLAAGRSRVHLAIPGRPRAGAALAGKANYFLGDLRLTGVPTYRAVRYADAWPGVDVVVYGTAGRFEYDLRLAPGADPSAIALAFDAPVRLARDGSLTVGGLTQLAPATYQGDRKVPSGYVLNPDGTVGFRLARYDRRRPLTIDPVLAYSAYLGGDGNDEAHGIAVDASGSAYVAGQTQSTNFPAGTRSGQSDAFVVKLAPDGRSTVWSTYLGGGKDEQGNGIALTGDGVIVGGWTTSANFPTASPIQGTLGGERDAFLTRLSATGVPVWSTYYGSGNLDEGGSAVAADPDGNAYLAGTLHPGDNDDAFVLKASPTGTLRYVKTLGGPNTDLGTAIAADASGNAYLAGAAADGFPATGGYGGAGDAFAAKLDAGGAVAYARYLGGSNVDQATAVAVSATGAVVAGYTDSPDFPATAPKHASRDAFVVRLDAAGAPASGLFLGGAGVDAADAVAVGKDGHVVVAGRTTSEDLPTVNPSQGTKGAGLDGFVTQLDGSTPLMSTYLGAGGSDEPHGVALDPLGNAYVTGATNGAFPEAGTDPPGYDGFVAKLGIGASPTPAPNPTVPPIPPAPAPAPETTITARPPAQTPDQVVEFRFAGQGAFACRIDGAAFTPCASPYTTPRLAYAQHTFEVRAVSASGVADPTPAAFTFQVARTRVEVKRTRCARKCDMEVRCPREALCLLALAAGSSRLQQLGAGTHVSCRRTCALGLVDASNDRRLRFRCSGRCEITAAIQRHVTEFGAASTDGAGLLVYAPAAGSVQVTGKAIRPVRATASSAGAVRLPLRRTAAAGKRAVTTKLTITFQPVAGPALTTSATVKLKRAAARRRARTRASARRSAARSRRSRGR